jgi:hypothetical protein
LDCRRSNEKESALSFWNLLSDAPPIFTRGKRNELTARYKRLRATAYDLGNKLATTLPADVVQEGGKKLGLLHGRKLILDCEDQLSVLTDYCIYNVYRDGLNAIDRYLANLPQEPHEEEDICLQAMRRATYTVVIIETLQPGLGAMVRDLRSGEVTLLADLAMSATAVPDLIMATRLLPVDDWVMTGGAALPIGLAPDEDTAAFFRDVAESLEPDAQGYFDPASLIRMALAEGGSAAIRYAGPEGPVNMSSLQPKAPMLRNPAALPPAKRREAPCPCGSGRKLKNCCLPKMGRRAK